MGGGWGCVWGGGYGVVLSPCFVCFLTRINVYMCLGEGNSQEICTWDSSIWNDLGGKVARM